jgi:hypothetical protein
MSRTATQILQELYHHVEPPQHVTIELIESFPSEANDPNWAAAMEAAKEAQGRLRPESAEGAYLTEPITCTDPLRSPWLLAGPAASLTSPSWLRVPCPNPQA